MAEGYARRSATDVDMQPVSIDSVNLLERKASCLTRIRTAVEVDIAYSVGETLVTPAAGEQWYITRIDTVWRLYGRIPYNDPTLLTEPVEGQVSVGGGRGPIEMHGTETRIHGDLVIGEDSYRSTNNVLQKKAPDGSWVPVVPQSGSSVISTDISDSSAVGRGLLTAADAPTARTAIGAGTYTKPGTGIPSTDLAAAVLASLSLANSALQTVGSTNIFDATSIGKQLLTAADTTAARTILNIGTGTSVNAADIVDSTLIGRNVLKAATALAARTAIGVDETAMRTPLDNSVSTVKIVDGNVTAAKLATDVQALINAPRPYDISFPATFGQRQVGYGLNTIGVKLQRAVVFTSVTFRVQTADASDSAVWELRKNGTSIASSQTTAAAGSQLAGITTTGNWAFAEGDVLNVYVVSNGGTPGIGLVADLKGTA